MRVTTFPVWRRHQFKLSAKLSDKTGKIDMNLAPQRLKTLQFV
jgi:hypothetical protein